MKKRFVFTFVAVVANMFALCGRDTLRISVLTMRTEYQICKNQTQNYEENTLNVSKDILCGNIQWTDKEVAAVLSAYNIGLMVTGAIGGPLSDAFSGKFIMMISSLIIGVCTGILPWMAEINIYAVIASQVISGMAGGFVCPTLTSMVARWEPTSERGRLSTIIYTGSPMSAVITAAVTGYINEHYNWRIPFVIFGMIQLFWLVPWCLFIYDSPSGHPKLDKDEKMLLNEETDTGTSRPKMSDIPFKRMILSSAVWGVILTNVGYQWVKSHTYLLLPQYMNYLGLSIQNNGLVSSLPFLGCVVVGLMASKFFSFLRSKGASMIAARKIVTSICLVGFGGLSSSVILMRDEPLPIIITTTIGYSLLGFYFVGAWNNPVDISPNYSGTIMGISNFFMYLTSVAVPYSLTLATALFPKEQIWFWLFGLVSVIAVTTNVIYLILGTADLQDWNSTELVTNDACAEDPIASTSDLKEDPAQCSHNESLDSIDSHMNILNK